MLQELVLRMSFREPSTDRGLLTDEDEVALNVLPLQPAPAPLLPREGLLSEEESNDCDDERGEWSLLLDRVVDEPSPDSLSPTADVPVVCVRSLSPLE